MTDWLVHSFPYPNQTQNFNKVPGYAHTQTQTHNHTHKYIHSSLHPSASTQISFYKFYSGQAISNEYVTRKRKLLVTFPSGLLSYILHAIVFAGKELWRLFSLLSLTSSIHNTRTLLWFRKSHNEILRKRRIDNETRLATHRICHAYSSLSAFVISEMQIAKDEKVWLMFCFVFAIIRFVFSFLFCVCTMHMWHFPLFIFSHSVANFLNLANEVKIFAYSK